MPGRRKRRIRRRSAMTISITGFVGELAIFRRIEGILDRAHRWRDDSLVLRSAPLKSGAPLECQMQFRGIAAHADIADAPHEAGIEMARCRARSRKVVLGLMAEMTVRPLSSSPSCRGDAGGPVILDDGYRFDPRTVRISTPSALNRLRHRIGDGTHAAARQCEPACRPFAAPARRL